MRKERNSNRKELILGYIKGILPMLLGVAFCVVVFGTSFYLANMDMSYFKMATEFVVFAFAVYMVITFVLYEKKRGWKADFMRVSEENSRLKTEMLAERTDIQEYFLTWVHQIKTPITVSKLLLDEFDNVESSENIKNVEHLKKEMIYIEDYANMALSYLKLINHERDMDITSVDLDSVIKPIVKRYSRLFIGNHIGLVYENNNSKVISDAKWLSILLEQIISNAIKYTKKGKVEISFDDNGNRLIISDSGIGIRQEDIPKIFDKGYSGFNGRLNQKSSGIGLYLAKQIAEKLSIVIDVESEIGQGSSFYINFNEGEYKSWD